MICAVYKNFIHSFIHSFKIGNGFKFKENQMIIFMIKIISKAMVDFH